jgi:hypothetical protein
MPRNRKRKPPAEPIEARLWCAPEPICTLEAAAEWHAHCGRCDQHIFAFQWHVKMMRAGRVPLIEWLPLGIPVDRIIADGSPVGRTLFSDLKGRVWDGEVWRVTADARARRHRAWLAEQRGNASTAERNRRRYDVWHRSNPRDTSSLPRPLTKPVRGVAGYLLPTKVECSACDAINIVDVAAVRLHLTRERAVG